ncbi:transmembrane protein 130 [Ascaphus truei]|uniref:transmembrane protein 130 n=1 Tax=Ascaphus truei TaxID=8439 RepID=UPI003F59EE62
MLSHYCTKHLQITGSPWSRAQMAPGCTPKLLRCLLLTALVNFTRGETIEGSVTAAQVERNPPSIRRGFILATNRDVQLSFMLHDPRNYFKSAVFIYRWNFGDRTRIVTGSAFASHNYSTAGTYKLSLQVSAHFQSSRHDRHTVQKTGSFTAALTLLDALKNITVTGSTETGTRQQFNMSLHFIGSSPFTVCWLIKSDCVSLDREECHPVVINDTTYIIRHLFNDAGRYCLSVRAHNEVSMLQNDYSITVYSTGVPPAWFVFPCCAFIAVALGFVIFTAFRAGNGSGSHPKSLVEVADFDFSPMSEKNQPLPKYKALAQGNGCCGYCAIEKTQDEKETLLEKQPLLKPLCSPVRSYML